MATTSPPLVSSDPPPQPDPEPTPTPTTTTTTSTETQKWPGWPGDCVFRLVVPVLKVGSIIGRKGDLIKKICEDTKARVRVLDAPVATPDRIVLISGKEEPDTSLSPAMDAVLRVFKRVSGLSEGDVDGQSLGVAGAAFCSIRLLVPSIQASSLIGKQGSLIKSIQESSGASARILQPDESPLYVGADERILELQGEALKVLKALEAVVGHLRRFLVDRGVLPLFEKNYKDLISQGQSQAETWAEKSVMHTAPQTTLATSVGSEYSLLAKRDSLFLDTESYLDSRITPSGFSHYRSDPVLAGLRSSGLGHSGAPKFVTQVAQIMQIPLSLAEDIIGIGGANIAYIRRTSGATLTVQESRGLPDEITVEIKGNASEVQMAQQLIQEFVSIDKEPVASSYGKVDAAGLRSSYSRLGSSSYSSSSLPSQPYGGYGASGGGYSSFRF